MAHLARRVVALPNGRPAVGELVKHTPPALEEELAELRKLQETIRAACDAIDAAVAGGKA